MDNIIFNVKLFLLIFSALSVIRDVYGLCKVIALQEGKYEMTNKRLILLGITISYIITVLIAGL